jgi:hypothetical protein
MISKVCYNMSEIKENETPNERRKSLKHTENTKKYGKEVNQVILRDYSKVILYYPLLIYSVVALIVQIIIGPSETLAIIWIFVFIYNTVAVGFNFPTAKFFLLFLSIVIIVMIFVLLDITGVIQWISLWDAIKPFFHFTLATNFYGWIILITGVMIIAALIASSFKYIRIERNEVYVRGVAAGKANRYPAKSVEIKINITDVFEFITIGAGSVLIELTPEKRYHFLTVPFVRRKKRYIDQLLSSTLVEDVKEL